MDTRPAGAGIAAAPALPGEPVDRLFKASRLLVQITGGRVCTIFERQASA